MSRQKKKFKFVKKLKDLTDFHEIQYQISSSVNRNLPELDNFEKILKKFKIWKNLNASIDYGQIQSQSSFMDVIYVFVCSFRTIARIWRKLELPRTVFKEFKIP